MLAELRLDMLLSWEKEWERFELLVALLVRNVPEDWACFTCSTFGPVCVNISSV